MQPMRSFLLATLAICLVCHSLPGLSESVMNGYAMKDFRDFEKKWHFVTVRYRKDSHELRLVYANDLAWKTLQTGKTEYPKGAVFGKIAFLSQEDPAFVSSLMPSATRRFQFMVRDSKKYADTGGWGYMLFNKQGQTFPEDQHQQTLACAACHKIVEANRGSVFSTPMSLGLTASDPLDHAPVDRAAVPHFEFEDSTVELMPAQVLVNLPVHTTKLRRLKGQLQDQVFQGTLDEIRPLLTKEALRSNLPVLLINSQGDRFSIVYLNPEQPACERPSERALISVTTQINNQKPLIQNFCDE